jgi:hypothetical protein
MVYGSVQPSPFGTLVGVTAIIPTAGLGRAAGGS